MAHSMLLRLPSALQPGDLVGIVAASGPPEPECLASGMCVLESLGHRVASGCHVLENSGYLAGTDEQRCRDLNAMFNDPLIRAIAFARGGYGTMRLLESLDLAAVMADPKLLIGMSDVTALQLSLFARAGLASLAGPMVAGQIGRGLDDLSLESLVANLANPFGERDLFEPVRSGLQVDQPGRASGVLLGGCLSLVTALLGTCHAPDFSNTILFLEDVNEPAYRIDRMLTHLKLAGVLDRVNGIVLGHFLGPCCTDLRDETSRILMELIGDRPIPVISGFPHGHTLPNLTVPIGIPVELNSEGPSLVVMIAESGEQRNAAGAGYSLTPDQGSFSIHGDPRRDGRAV
jgi:muramoyltetrapeptide carboxypeptidase